MSRSTRAVGGLDGDDNSEKTRVSLPLAWTFEISFPAFPLSPSRGDRRPRRKTFLFFSRLSPFQISLDFGGGAVRGPALVALVYAKFRAPEKARRAPASRPTTDRPGRGRTREARSLGPLRLRRVGRGTRNVRVARSAVVRHSTLTYRLAHNDRTTRRRRPPTTASTVSGRPAGRST
jgi:hypothetical protein